MDYAIVIGINDYMPPSLGGLRTLGGAIRDAEAIEQWLLSESGGRLPKQNCRKIISTPNPLFPLKDQIDDEIESIIREIMINGIEARRFYFYFAGHGLGVEQNVTDTALCLVKWSEIRRSYAISVEKYRNMLLATGYFKQVIFWADCCRNIVYNVEPESSTVSLPTNGPHAGRTRFLTGYATQYQDESYEIENDVAEKRGVFTQVLIKGLNGGGANPKGEVDADYLRNYLLKETPVLAEKNGYKQVPEIMHSFNIHEPCIFNIVPINIKVAFGFSPNRLHQVEIIDGKGETRMTLDPTAENPVQILLTKGLYKAVDTGSGESHYFTISSENEENHVSF